MEVEATLAPVRRRRNWWRRAMTCFRTPAADVVANVGLAATDEWHGPAGADLAERTLGWSCRVVRTFDRG
jgi:hypothetical protein